MEGLLTPQRQTTGNGLLAQTKTSKPHPPLDR
jgi:hypothetical protein